MYLLSRSGDSWREVKLLVRVGGRSFSAISCATVLVHSEQGLTLKVEAHKQRVPRSQRGGEVIEPLVSSQWFVKTEGMGAKALAAVVNKDVKILPERCER